MGTWLRSHEQEVTITMFLSMLLSFLVFIGIQGLPEREPETHYTLLHPGFPEP